MRITYCVGLSLIIAGWSISFVVREWRLDVTYDEDRGSEKLFDRLLVGLVARGELGRCERTRGSEMVAYEKCVGCWDRICSVWF